MSYRYREYPRHVHRPHGVSLIVRTEAERDAALAEGWSLSAVFDALGRGGEPPAPPVADDAVASALTRPRRGRPPKGTE